jgi:hypothetical protein
MSVQKNGFRQEGFSNRICKHPVMALGKLTFDFQDIRNCHSDSSRKQNSGQVNCFTVEQGMSGLLPTQVPGHKIQSCYTIHVMDTKAAVFTAFL